MSTETDAIAIAEFLLGLAPKLVELWRTGVSRDAVLVGLDAVLAAARAKTDADLAAKPRNDA